MASVFGGWWRLALVAAGGLATVAGCGESFVSTTGNGGGGSGGGSGATGGSTATTGGGATGGGGSGGGPACVDGDKLACYTGDLATRHVGACADGQKQCDNGQWGPCEGQTLPAEETCNDQDDDCDGQVDDGLMCSCTDGAPCFPFGGMAQPGNGNCKSGMKVCENGKFKECMGAVGPVLEICNGFDDDCDGVLDDVDGLGNSCDTGNLGVCKAGSLHCNLGTMTVDCSQDTQASEEQCDGLDNDCDGKVDDIAPEACELQLPAPESACDGVKICTQQNQKICSADVFFVDDFSSPVNGGWSFNNEWSIGSAMSGAQPGAGNPDPAMDHTPSMDNGVAGVVIGGNMTGAITYSYMTSKEIPTAGTTLWLSFWRWLNANGLEETPHQIQVMGSNNIWVTVWDNKDGPVYDSAWVPVAIDLSNFAGQSIRIRFGFARLLTGAGTSSVSSWNIDDLAVASCPVGPPVN